MIEVAEHRASRPRGRAPSARASRRSKAARWRTRASQGRAPVTTPTRPLAVDARRRLARRTAYAMPHARVDGEGARVAREGARSAPRAAHGALERARAAAPRSSDARFAVDGACGVGGRGKPRAMRHRVDGGGVSEARCAWRQDLLVIISTTQPKTVSAGEKGSTTSVHSSL